MPAIGVTYSGAQGDDTLVFKAKSDGTIGEDKDLKIEVRNGSDTKIDELNFRNLTPDTRLTLFQRAEPVALGRHVVGSAPSTGLIIDLEI